MNIRAALFSGAVFSATHLAVPPEAAPQSACLPPPSASGISPVAAGVHQFVTVLGHANDALALIDRAEASTVFLNLRSAVTELRCAQSLAALPSLGGDSTMVASLSLTATLFGVLSTGIDDARADFVRQLDSNGVAETATEADRRAARTEMVQSSWRNLAVVTLGILEALKGPLRSERIAAITLRERDALLEQLRFTFGKVLAEPDARRGYPLLAAYTIQSFLLSPEWHFREQS